MRGHMAIQGASNLDALCLCLLIFLVEHHLNEASILAKMCVAHLINLEGGGGGASAPLAPPPPPPPPALDPTLPLYTSVKSLHAIWHSLLPLRRLWTFSKNQNLFTRISNVL